MFSWLLENLGSIIITIILIAVVTAIIFVLYRDKKRGKSTCGGNCGHCPMGGSCHHGK